MSANYMTFWNISSAVSFINVMYYMCRIDSNYLVQALKLIIQRQRILVSELLQ